MENVLIIIAAILPALLLWVYIWKKDQKKEPTLWLVKAVCYGVIICLPVVVVEIVLEYLLFSSGGYPSTILGTTANAFLVAAIPEELFKLLALWLVLVKNPYFDEHFDGIVYAVCVGLGFASVENVFYLFGNIEDWMSVAFVRSLLSVPGHYAYAVLMGFYYSKYYFVSHTRQTAAMIIVAPVLAHGIYDALLMTSGVNVALGSICFIVLVVFAYRLQIYARKKIVAMVNYDKSETIDITNNVT